MAALHDAALRGPARISTLGELRQWAVDHDQSDRDQFASIDRKLNFLIGGGITVLLTVLGALAHDDWSRQQDRLQALEHPAAAAAPR